jgi:hypothetical protein
LHEIGKKEENKINENDWDYFEDRFDYAYQNVAPTNAQIFKVYEPVSEI